MPRPLGHWTTVIFAARAHRPAQHGGSDGPSTECRRAPLPLLQRNADILETLRKISREAVDTYRINRAVRCVRRDVQLLLPMRATGARPVRHASGRARDASLPTAGAPAAFWRNCCRH